MKSYFVNLITVVIIILIILVLSLETGLLHYTPYYLIKSEIIGHKIFYYSEKNKKDAETRSQKPKLIQKFLETDFSQLDQRQKLLKEKCQDYFKVNKKGIRRKNDDSKKPKLQQIKDYKDIFQLAEYFPTDRIHFDQKFGNLYCFPPKSGTTNWNRLISSLNLNISISELLENYDHNYVYDSTPHLAQIDNIFKHQDISLRQNLYSEKEISYKTFKSQEGSTTKINNGILLTRHPFTRLYSSWGHRLSNINPSHRMVFRRQIMTMKNKYQRPSDYPAPNHVFVTFSSFLRFVCSDEAHSKNLLGNIHWFTISDLCQPCELQNYYNNLVTTETSEVDAGLILKKMTVFEYNKTQKVVDFPKIIGPFPKAYSKNSNSKNSFGEVPQSENVNDRISGIQRYFRDHVDDELKMEVFRRYYWDFSLFGYTTEGFMTNK